MENVVLKTVQLASNESFSDIKRFETDLKEVVEVLKNSGVDSAEFYFQNLGSLRLKCNFTKGEL